MECYLGMVMTFAYNWAPVGFAACNGQLLNIQQNSALYALLGNNFGGNPSQNTFGVPNLQGRAPVHFGTAQGGTTNRAFAEQFGLENETLTQTQLPAHIHAVSEKVAGQTVTAAATASVKASSAQGNLPTPAGNYWAKVVNASTVLPAYATPSNATMASDAVTVTVTPAFSAANLNVGITGNGQPFPLAQPSLALNFCISTQGLFPSRS